MAYRGTNIKPTVVFLARFFLEGLERRLWLKINGLQQEKSQKVGKMRKKVQNKFHGTPVFLRNGPIYRPKTVLFRRHSL
jgi:hypothetical protein